MFSIKKDLLLSVSAMKSHHVKVIRADVMFRVRMNLDGVKWSRCWKKYKILLLK